MNCSYCAFLFVWTSGQSAGLNADKIINRVMSAGLNARTIFNRVVSAGLNIGTVLNRVASGVYRGYSIDGTNERKKSG